MEAGAGRFVVMGVSGVGKTRIGAMLAEALGGRFVEGDDLHPESNRAKMARGTPLSDEDRWPWLDRVGAALAEGAPPVVAACSALKRRYRDRLRGWAPDLVALHLLGGPVLVEERLRARKGHFMPPALLADQFETLEPLEADERGFAADAGLPPDVLLRVIRDGIASL